MKASELIELLEQIPGDTEVTIYNNQYAGIDKDLESDPVLLLDCNLNLIICDDYTEGAARYYYGELFTIDQLAAVEDGE